MTFSLATLLLSLLPSVINAIPGIGAKVKQLIQDATLATTAVLSSGAITQPSIANALTGWLGVITVLKTDPGINAAWLAYIAQLEKIVQAVVNEDDILKVGIDWTKFHDIQPVA